MTVADEVPRPADWFGLHLHADADHHAGLAAARARAPVGRVTLFDGALDATVVYGYEDALRVLGDDEAFSVGVVEQRYGAVLGRSMLTAAPVARRALRVALSHRLRPEADDLSRVVTDVVARRVDELDAATGRDVVDLLPPLAGQVPARVMTHLLGLPEEEWNLVSRLAAGAAGLLERPRVALRAARGLRRHFREQPRADADVDGGAGRDLRAALRATFVEGRPLEEPELLASLLLLAWAGTETTVPAVMSTLYALLADPRQAQTVRDDPTLALSAVDEALRWEAPVQITSRTAERDVVVGGTRVAAGTTLLVHLGATGRDERRFREPGSYRLGRDEGPHLAFGHGVHRCPGWRLARAEVAECVRALLARFPDLHLAPGSPPPEGTVVRSPRRLLVHLR